MAEKKDLLKRDQRIATRIAKELRYDNKCFEDIHNATSANEITRALISARRRKDK